MQKLVAILLIAAFFSAHYARQFAYLQCKLATWGTVGTEDCGCGQLTNIDRLGDEGHPVSKNHAHLHLDDFFAQPVQPTQAPVAFCLVNTVKPNYQQHLCQGCSLSIDRPPQMG